jgi:hypothetical protein
VSESMRVYRVFIVQCHMKNWLYYPNVVHTARHVLYCHGRRAVRKLIFKQDANVLALPHSPFLDVIILSDFKCFWL